MTEASADAGQGERSEANATGMTNEQPAPVSPASALTAPQDATDVGAQAGTATGAASSAPPTQSPPGGRGGRDARVGADDGYRGPSAPSVPVPVWKRRLFIDRPADLAAFVAEAHDATALAIDAEFTTTFRRNPADPPHRLTLLQFAFDNDFRASYVVDALRLYDLSPLQEVLGRAATLKLFHGIGADTQVLATRGLAARYTLDLEAVSRSLFGSHASGLQAMAQRAFGVRLDKSLQRADWSRRPLTPAMVAYAARDAEITYALADWLTANYPAQVALYVVPADEAAPDITATWVAASLERGRAYPIEDAVEDAGLTEDVAAQTAALRQAFAAVQRPQQRARLMRYISDLALTDLAPDLRPALAAPTAEERAGAARALGRLRDQAAEALLRPLTDDPVPDVRQAATLALDNLKSSTPPRLPYRRALARAHDERQPSADVAIVSAGNAADAGAAGAATASAKPVANAATPLAPLPPSEDRAAPRGPHRGAPPRPNSASPRMWTTGPADDDEAPADDWRAALRARFGAHSVQPPADDLE